MPKLLFVYNADSGPIVALKDAAHKLLRPTTYQCDLCAVTHGAVAMKREWRDYVSQLPYPAEFYHRDQFRRAYPRVEVPLPAIMIEDGAPFPRILVPATDMRADMSVADLAAKLDGALARQRGQMV